MPHCFSDVIPKVPEEDVPPRLKDLFTYVAATREEGLNIFGNGAGKSFAKDLQGLLPIKRWVRTSTTPTPHQTDWCGVHTPQLRGVVDVAVVKGGAWLVVGEIKGGHASPFTQILPGMQGVAIWWGFWYFWRCYIHEGFSNAGFTMNHRALNLLLPHPRDKVVTILHKSYIVLQLEDIIQFLSDLQCLLEANELAGGIAQLTLSEQEEEECRAMTLESRVQKIEETLEELKRHLVD
jgi:hypothetical protein